MKSLTDFLQQVLEELGTWCDTSTGRDMKTITARVESEGISFITITLPSFVKDFERSLELGKVGPQLFTGFRRRGELPLFLGGFLDQIFERETGLLVDEPNVDCIRAIRQVGNLFQKIGLACSTRRTRKAIQTFIDCESDVRKWELRLQEGILGYQSTGSLGDDFNRFLDLLPFFGVGCSPMSQKDGKITTYFLSMGLDPLPTNLRETKSLLSINGPIGSKAADFHIIGTLLVDQGFMTLTMSCISNLVPRYP